MYKRSYCGVLASVLVLIFVVLGEKIEIKMAKMIM